MPRVLIVTAAFAPGALAGTQRSTQLVRRLGEHGWSAAVLTIPGHCYSRQGPSLLSMVPSDAPVHMVPCASFRNHSHRWRDARSGPARAAAFARRLAARVTSSWLPVDDCYSWALRATSNGVDLVRNLGADLIWATAPAWSAHVLAHRITRRTGVPFIADFRNVRAASSEGGSRQDQAAARAERSMLRDAAGITYDAPGQRDLLEARHGGLGDTPCTLAYNGFDATDTRDASPREFDAPTLLSGEILYGGTRRVDGVMEALARSEASDAGPALRFVSMTPRGDDWDYLTGLCERFDLGNRLVIQEPVPRPEFLSACKGADALLLAVGRDKGRQVHAGAIPVKLFNYLVAGRPILVVGPPGCEVGSIVERLNRGIFAVDYDVDGIADALARSRADQGVAGPLDLALESAGEFEATAAVSKLCGFFDTVVAGRETATVGLRSAQVASDHAGGAS